MKKLLAAALGVLALLPAAANAQITLDLSVGSKGPQVVELQNFLIANGFFTGAATGNFYALTKKAVQSFQKARGISQTGTVGPKTRAAINGSIVASAPAVPVAIATGTPSSAIAQTYATTSSAFDFDPKWHDAVVNFLCTDRFGGGLSSGTGVIVDPRGIILTNAHVAVDFLFTEWPNPSLEECTVRVGSPAAGQYKAALLYFPAGFVQDEVANTIPDDSKFVGGKDDYALLVITGTSYASAKMPATFPYIPFYTAVPPVNSNVYLDGYAAEFTSYETLQRGLYQLASPAVVGAQRGIGSSTAKDVLAFKGSLAGQHGSSGGAVIAQGGQLAGIITFFDEASVDQFESKDKVINAITTDYIARDFLADTGTSLQTYLSNSDLIGLSEQFMSTYGSVYQKAFAKWWRSKGQVVPGYYE